MPITPSEAPVLPALFDNLTGDWRFVGSGTLTWSVFRMYGAKLYCADATCYPDGRYALVLHYLRNLSADQIVAASAMEMKRLAEPSDNDLQIWTDALHTIMPDVVKGDTVTGVFDGSQGVRFFYNDHPCGEIASAEFSRAFAAIWLSEGTRSPALRLSLLGEHCTGQGQ